MKSFIATITYCLCTCVLLAGKYDVIRVGLFWDNRPLKASYTEEQGSFEVYADGKLIASTSEKKSLSFQALNGKVTLKSNAEVLGSFKEVSLVQKTYESQFKIKPQSPVGIARSYNGTLDITVFNGRLAIINEVPLEQYIAGVVQSESGNGNPLEYYKSQSIISRTYALKYWDKFEKLGFNVCDRVDSQVYKHRCLNNDTIMMAVKETQDIVIVDSEINLISAVFHSNSGGQTMNSEDVWVGAVPYLRAVSDSFSANMPHYNWSVHVRKEKWLSHFEDNHGLNQLDSVKVNDLINYCPQARLHEMTGLYDDLRLRELREVFSLKSTYFCVCPLGNDSLQIQGYGFGHGVGLSQEGAMKMAALGYPYNEILHHYYTDIHLIKLSAIDFFRGE